MDFAAQFIIFSIFINKSFYEIYMSGLLGSLCSQQSIGAPIEVK